MTIIRRYEAYKKFIPWNLWLDREELTTYDIVKNYYLYIGLENCIEMILKCNLFMDADAPVCRHQQTEVYGVGRAEKTTITCRVEADPPATRYRWAFNSTGEFINIPR